MTLVNKLIIKILNLKLAALLEYQNIKIFLQNVTFQISLKKLFVVEKLKILFQWHMLLMILMEKKLLERFTKKNQKEFRIEKVIERKVDKLYVKWKEYNNSFNNWIDEKEIIWINEYFPEPKYLGERVKFELDMSNYATKRDLKNARGVDTSVFAKRIDLANPKSDLDKLDIDKVKNVPGGLRSLKNKVYQLDVVKLLPVPVDLSKLNDIIKNDVDKKDVYNAKIKNTEHKIPDITKLATNASLNATTNEVKVEIPNITNLATTAALTTVENKTPIVGNFF